MLVTIYEPMWLSMHLRCCRAVHAAISHGEQYVAAASCEGIERLIVKFPLTDFAIVVRRRCGISQGGEHREEHRALQLFVSSLRRALARAAQRGESSQWPHGYTRWPES